MLVQRRTPNDPAYWCFLLLGAGTLFPWNVLITAADFWEARYPGKHTDRLLTVCYLPTNLIVIAAMVHWHGRIRTRLRITAGLLGFTLALVGVVWIDVLPPSDASLAAVLLLVALCGVCDGLAQGALFGEVALLPPRYTQALVAGTAASGVVVSLLRIITKATLPDTEAGLRRSATIYFCIGAAVCAACTIVYAQVLPRMASMRQHRQAALEAALRDASSVVCAENGGTAGWKLAAASLEQQGELSPPLPPQQQQRQQPDLELSFEDRSAVALQDSQQLYPGGSSPCRDSDTLSALHSPDQALLHNQRGFSSSTSGGLTGGSPRRRHQLGSLRGAVGGSDVACSASRPETWTVLPQIWQLAAALVLIYTVTLSIFPGVLAEDVHSAELGSWYPVALLTAFNIADFIGKTVPSMAALRLRSQRAILVTTLSRALFIPAFHFAAVGGAGPAVIGLLAVLLGLSNGYLTAVSMMLGPAAVPPAAAEVAGNLMVLCLIAGLCIGAAGSFVWLM